MKTLYVDLENGYKTLGSKDKIKQMFGYQPLSFNDFSGFRQFIKQVWSVQMVETTVDIDGVKIKQNQRKVIAKDGTNVECLVIDTGSEMAKQYARELKGPADALKLQQWGKLKILLIISFHLQIQYLLV